MALLPKKPNAKQAAALLLPAWHPNFRNFERLPDTKLVRTSFFINAAAICVTLGVVIYTGWSEYGLHLLRGEVEQQQLSIDKFKAQSDESVTLFRKFQDEEKKLQEVQDFADARFVPSEFLIHLAETLPDKIAFRQFDYRASGITLRGTVQGSPDEASGAVAGYIDKLRSDKVFLTLFDEIQPNILGKNAESGWLTFELLLKLKPAAKEAKK